MQDGGELLGLRRERLELGGDLRRLGAQALGDAGGARVEQVVGQDLVQHESAQVEALVAEGVYEELGLPRGNVLEGADDDERRTPVVQQAVDGLGPLDEAVVHGLEGEEELGDVLEELRAEDAVCDLVEGPGREVDEARAGRGRQPAQEAAAEEVGHVLGRLEEIDGVPRGRRVHHDQVVVPARVDLVEPLHGDVVVALHEAAREVLVQGVVEDALGRRLVWHVQAHEGVP